MQYLISFLEGIITFISPCLLPMLPIYISYFGGGGQRDLKKTLFCATGFVLGFTAVFVALGALASTLGGLLKAHQTAVNIISGVIVILFGLNYLGILKFNLFRGSNHTIHGDMSFFSAFIFGIIFSVGWTPCVGTFLGSALMLASQQGHILAGMGMLLCYSLGLGIPFFVQRRPHRQTEVHFQFYQAALFGHQQGLRRTADPDRHSHGHRHIGQTSHTAQLRR